MYLAYTRFDFLTQSGWKDWSDLRVISFLRAALLVSRKG